MYQLNQIPSEAQIRKYLRRILFGKNAACPVCTSRKVVTYEDRYRCRRCRAKFSLLSHTWLGHLRIPLAQFWIILWAWTCALPVKQTMALARLSEPSVRRWFALFRTHLPHETHVLERLVQLDEAFFKKTALMIGKEIGTRKLAWDIIPGGAPQRHHAAYFLFRKVKPDARLWTDDAAIYRGIGKWWPVTHAYDRHAKWEFGKTSEIEGVIGNYRTFVRRMYHHHWSSNLPEYVREFCFRFSSPDLFENPLYYLQKSLSLVPIA